MKHLLAAAALLTLVASSLASADAPKAAVAKPVKVTAADAIGPMFKGKAAVHENSPTDGATTDVVLLKSRDGRYEAGLYEAGPSDYPIESYEEDEFIVLLDGAIKLTSADGSVVEGKAGEALAIPKGWKGRWTTQGYKKYYVTYNSAKKSK